MKAQATLLATMRINLDHMTASNLSLPCFCCIVAVIVGLDVGLATSAEASDRCAVYGPGFTAVSGTETCVRIGGHVRVEAHTRGSTMADTGWDTGRMVPAGIRSERSENVDPFAPAAHAAPAKAQAPSHLRVHADTLSFADPFRQ